jgi:hypothetical protein
MTLGSGRTISGDGFVNGSFTVASGATLSPGNKDLGALVFSNSLTLNAGCRTILSVSHDQQANNAVSAGTTLTFGGSLVVSNFDDPLQGGDSFKLFSAPAFAGSFSGITLPALAQGLYWNTNSLKATGSISVGIETPPVFGAYGVSGQNFVMSGTGGITNGNYYVLCSTNIATPLTNWTRLQTNQFDSSGNFIFSNAINPGSVQNYYLLQLP